MGISSNLTDPLVSAALSLATIFALLLIFTFLRRSPRIQNIGPVYLVATGLLGVAMLLNALGMMRHDWPQDLLLTTLLVLWGYVLFDLIEDLLFDRALRRTGVAIPRLARDILRAVTIAALVLVAVNRFFGVPLSSLVISSTVVSAVIGLALQDLLKDVFAGVALQIERPFVPGDWIEFNGQIARIIEMNWRATRAVSVDNTHMIVPNAILATAQLTNYTIISPIQALHVQIILAPEHPPNRVKAVLTAAAQAAEGVLSDPAPAVRLVTYGEYSLTYDIKFWMQGFDRYIETRDAVMTSAWYFIRRAGFRLPTPLRELYMHEADPHFQSDAELRLTNESVAVIRSVELFASLSDEELSALALRAKRCLFGHGEVLVRQDDIDDALYIVRHGRVRVEAVVNAGGAVAMMNELVAGDFFGEFALLTGLPRRATVTAIEDTETLRIRRDAISPLLARNPALAERMSAILERRVAQRQILLAATSNSRVNKGTDLSQPGLLRRIRSLFEIGG